MSDYLKKGLRGSLIVFIFIILANICGYFTRIFLARTITPEEYGLFYAVFTLFMFVGVFTDLGYNQAIIKYIPQYLTEKKFENIKRIIFSIFLIEFILSIIAIIVLYFLRNFLAVHYYHNPLAVQTIELFLVILLLNTLNSLLLTIFQSYQEFIKYGLLYFLNKFLFLAFSIIFVYFGFAKDIFIPTISFLLSSILTLILFIPLIYSHLKKIIREKTSYLLNKTLFLEISNFAFPNLITSTAGLVISYIDTMLLTYFVSLELVGIYNAILPTVLMLSYFSVAISTALFPMISEIWTKKEYGLIKESISLVYKYSLITILPFSIIIFIFPEAILNILFGPSFVIGSNPLRIISMGVIFLSLAQVNFSVLNGIGKPKAVTKTIIISSLINTIISLVLISKYGLSGAVYGTTISYIVMFLFTYYIIKRDIKFNINKIGKVLISGIVLSIILWIFRKNNLFQTKSLIILYLVIIIIIYIGLVFSLKIIEKRELNNILSKLISK